MMKNILLIGATSAIAQETARIYAGQGAKLFLLGRNEATLNAVAEDLRVRGAAAVTVYATDLLNTDKHGELIEAVLRDMP